MYLEISPGGGKYWRLKYRFAGKEKRLALGVYPEVGAKEARVRRDEARLLAHGVDPSIERRVQKAATVERAANSFEAVAREWFARQAPGWASSHADKVIARLENDVFPWLGGRAIAEMKAPEVLLAVLRRVEARGALDTAHRVHQNCGQVFRYAVATGRAERDVSADLRGAPQRVMPHFAAVTEPAEVLGLLRALDGFQGTFVVQCALRLAPLLFVRPGELRTAQWTQFDFDRAQWRYTVSKTKRNIWSRLLPKL